jgi:MFS family permease
VQGAAFSFNMPARQALIAELVGPDDLANALALQNAGLSLNRVAGPAIGGALLSVPAVGATGVFGIMTGLYALVLVLVHRLPATVGRTVRLPRTPASGASQLMAGMTYVASQAHLRRLLLLAFLPLLFGMPYQALMPALAAEVFQVDAGGLGVLLTANGIGALAGSLVLARLGKSRRLGRLQLGSGILFGVALVAFALVGSFLPALGFVALAGGASAIYSASNSTLLMSQTPPDYHGRVMGVYFMTFAAMPLSSLPAAWVADQIGLPATIAASGAISAAVVALAAGRFR